jgi:hypothetical protein
MIKCLFVDLSNITSDIPRSNFPESDLAKIADLILATDGLLRPLILKASGVERYTVIEGDREYYAALKAKEKDISKAEMINAFIIDPKIQQSAIEQLKILTADSSTPKFSQPVAPSIEQLLPTLLAAISQQIQPIVDQLSEHKQILDSLKLARPVEITKQPHIQPKVEDTQSTTISGAIATPKAPEVAEVTPNKSTKTSTKSSTLPTSIDPEKITITLDLINTLGQEELTIRMGRSGISKAVSKLAPKIILTRSLQPQQKFDTWETIASAKITGLGSARIKEIIEKLK